jgi:hypothetical protein
VNASDTRTSLIVTSSGGLIDVVGVLAALLPKQDQNYRYPSALVIALIGSIVTRCRTSTSGWAR